MKQLIFNSYIIDSETGKIRWFPDIPYDVVFEDETSFYLAPQNGTKCGIQKCLEGDFFEVSEN